MKHKVIAGAGCLGCVVETGTERILQSCQPCQTQWDETHARWTEDYHNRPPLPEKSDG